MRIKSRSQAVVCGGWRKKEKVYDRPRLRRRLAERLNIRLYYLRQLIDGAVYVSSQRQRRGSYSIVREDIGGITSTPAKSNGRIYSY